jgi:uncharacterized protein YbjT (DUF2867 family)
MIGSGVLAACLADPSVDLVISVGRSEAPSSHPSLRQIVRADLTDLSEVPELAGIDACFFCVGVSAAGMNEAAYRRITYDLTLSVAEKLVEAAPGITVCYVSGQGTDSTEVGRFMWARVKGATENRLLGMGIEAYMFRPGFVRPADGTRSRTPLYNVFYAVAGPLYPILRRLFPKYVTTAENVGRAMIRVAREGYSKPILENEDINALAP